MGHKNRKVTFWMLGALVGIALAFNPAVHAQSYTPGQPVIADNNQGSTTDGIFWDAKQFAGSDVCAQIYAAWSTAMASGVVSATIDARGITGAQTCAASPFPNHASGRLLLGNTQIKTAVTWQIPSHVHIEGLGVSGLDHHLTANTTILAGSSAADPVIQLGNSDFITFDIQVKGLTVDAFGRATTGILNNGALEGSTLEDVNIYNATLYGLLLVQSQSNHNDSAAGSGPYRNLNIQYDGHCPTCGTGTIGIMVWIPYVQLNSALRGIDNATVSGLGTKGRTIGSCITIIGFPILITNSHVEFCNTGIQIGAAGALETTNVEIINTTTDPFAGWNISITNASNVLLSGILGHGVKLLQDNVTGNQIMGNYKGVSPLGFYLLGEGANPAVISTAASQSGQPLAWVSPSDMHVTGNLTKASGTFKIDHPLDPANKYLYHSFVESPDRMDVYNGTVTTDKHGMAAVALPDYFEALNRDFRYQLTPIGALAQATVAKEIEDNRFAIQTSKPEVKVSWQVTGIRRDAYATAHEMKVEEEKPASERGHYLHPEALDTSGKRDTERAVDK